MEASNSCARTMTSVPSLLLPFYQSFFPFIRSFSLSALLPFLLFQFVFYHPSFSLFFFALVLSLFFGFPSLAYPNLLGTERLGCCCCMKRRTISVAEATVTQRASKTCHRQLRCVKGVFIDGGEGHIARPMSCHGGGGVVTPHVSNPHD
jgi:hypothetical protein